MKYLMLLCLFIASCTGTDNNHNVTPTTNNRGAVIIGVGNSKWAGPCLGTDEDVKCMKEVLEAFYDVYVLQDAQATKSNVISTVQHVIDKYDDVTIYYSGHGGSQKFDTTGAEEVDGRDEFLCLYDTYLIDNEIYDLIRKVRGKVFLMIDACHSQTMFRCTPRFMSSRKKILAATHKESGDINMICWSGCPDTKVSYGGAYGGKFTLTFCKYFNSNLTYNQLWDKIENDPTLKQYEEVQQTKIGKDFGDNKIFR